MTPHKVLGLDEEADFIQHLTENENIVLWIAQYEPYKMLYLSDSYGNVWGRPKKDIYETPTSWQNHITQEHRERIAELWKHAPEGKYQCEYEIERPDGEKRWILPARSSNASGRKSPIPWRSPNGNVSGSGRPES